MGDDKDFVGMSSGSFDLTCLSGVSGADFSSSSVLTRFAGGDLVLFRPFLRATSTSSFSSLPAGDTLAFGTWVREPVSPDLPPP